MSKIAMNLYLEPGVIERAEEYGRRRGINLSSLVSDYLDVLTRRTGQSQHGAACPAPDRCRCAPALKTEPKRMRLTFMAVGLAALSVVRSAEAQSTGAPCAYDVCSLRIDGSAFVRGKSETVGRIGQFSAPSLEQLVLGTSDSARAYARLFDRNYATGARLRFASTMAIGLGVAKLYIDVADDVDSEGMVGGGLVLGGLVLRKESRKYVARAIHGLNRAVWWHNRDIQGAVSSEILSLPCSCKRARFSLRTRSPA